jgi:hypothetical protein
MYFFIKSVASTALYNQKNTNSNNTEELIHIPQQLSKDLRAIL